MNSFLDKTGLTYFWGKISTALGLKADKIQEVNHGTSDTTFTLTPNVMHIWGTVSSLNLSLPTDSNSTLDEYLFTFTCPTGGTTLTLPASIVWIQEPEFEEGKTYQVSIVNGLAGFLTNNMVAGGGGSVGTETDPIFKASPAYGIAASDITNWNGKQAALVSGTNIKTVNNESLLGSGNITIQGGGGDTNVIEVVKVNGTALTPDSNKAVDVPVPTESTVSNWGFTKNTGTYSKPSGGIPKTDLASAVQTSLGKADTALQSYTETDPIFTASAAHGITSSDITSWNSKISSSELSSALSGLFTQLTNDGDDISVTIGGTNKTLTVGYASTSKKAGDSWTSVVTIGEWSKVLKISSYAAVLLSIRLNFSSQSANVTYLINNAYSFARIVQIGTGGYKSNSNFDIRITRSGTTTIDVEIKTSYTYQSATTQNVVCHAVNIHNSGTLTPYTSYTAGSGTLVDSFTSYSRYSFIGNSLRLNGSSTSTTSPDLYIAGTSWFGGAIKVGNAYIWWDDTNSCLRITGADSSGNPSASIATNLDVSGTVAVYSGSSAPSSSLGKNGDIYIQTS